MDYKDFSFFAPGVLIDRDLSLILEKKHEINPVWITCNPDKIASRRTCEIAGGKLAEIIDLPNDNDQYLDGDRQKCRYRFDLSAAIAKFDCRILLPAY